MEESIEMELSEHIIKKQAEKIIRYLLQQLEAIDVVKKDKKSEMKKNSRIITKIGQTDLNRIATEIANKK